MIIIDILQLSRPIRAHPLGQPSGFRSAFDRALERLFVETYVYKISPPAIVAQAIRARPASNNRKRISHCGIHFEFPQRYFPVS
jgi:hypothetical protein